MERREAVPRPHPVGDHRRQHGPAASRRHLQPVAVDHAQRLRVLRVDLDERTRVEPVEPGDPAGLGEGVPLVLQPPGVEAERVVLVRQFGGRQVRPGEEHRPPGRGREGQPRPVSYTHL